MVILVRDKSGVERALSMADGGWEARPVEGNESIIELTFPSEGHSIILDVAKYEEIKRKLIVDGSVIDTSEPADIPV